MATDTKVPVRNSRGDVIGEALVSENGDVINVEISDYTFSQLFAMVVQDGLSDGLIVQPYFNHGIPRNMINNIKENNNATTP